MKNTNICILNYVNYEVMIWIIGGLGVQIMPRPTADYEPVNLNALHITSSALLFQDLYLYYFLFSYPERTLVFCNSKDCLRRLTSIFTLLKCKPLPLHADMHQKQRLKNLEKFSSKLWSFSSSSTCRHAPQTDPNYAFHQICQALLANVSINGLKHFYSMVFY